MCVNDLPVLCRVTSHQCVLPTVTPSSLAEVVWAILGRFPKYGSLLCRQEVYLLLNWLAFCSSLLYWGGDPQPRAMKDGGKVIFRLYSVSGGREKTGFIIRRCVLFCRFRTHVFLRLKGIKAARFGHLVESHIFRGLVYYESKSFFSWAWVLVIPMMRPPRKGCAREGKARTAAAAPWLLPGTSQTSRPSVFGRTGAAGVRAPGTEDSAARRGAA